MKILTVLFVLKKFLVNLRVKTIPDLITYLKQKDVSKQYKSQIEELHHFRIKKPKAWLTTTLRKTVNYCNFEILYNILY